MYSPRRAVVFCIIRMPLRDREKHHAPGSAAVSINESAGARARLRARRRSLGPAALRGVGRSVGPFMQAHLLVMRTGWDRILYMVG